MADTSKSIMNSSDKLQNSPFHHYIIEFGYTIIITVVIKTQQMIVYYVMIIQ